MGSDISIDDIMEMTNRRIHRAIAVVFAATAVVTASACSTDESAEGRCGGDPPLCYPADVARDWCYVEQVRNGVVDGRLSAADLPSWVDLTKRKDGRPQVYDFTTTDPNNWAGWSDDLRNSIRATGKTWNSQAVNECSDRHDIRDVIKSEGEPRS